MQDLSVFRPEDLVGAGRPFGRFQSLGLPPTMILWMVGDVPQGAVSRGVAQTPFFSGKIAKINEQLAVLSRIGFGAPNLIFHVELLRALGVRNFILVGTAGSLRKDCPLGSVVSIEASFSDEGTSRHYGHFEGEVSATQSLVAALLPQITSGGHSPAPVKSWTTDAPFCETPQKIAQMANKGASVVEMEASALFAVARAREFQAAAFAVVSDQLYTGQWVSNFAVAQKELRRIFDHLIKVSL